jgi:hypothetical protein
VAVATCVTIALPEEGWLVHTPPLLAAPATAMAGAARDVPTQPLPPEYTPWIASTVDSST